MAALLQQDDEKFLCIYMAKAITSTLQKIEIIVEFFVSIILENWKFLTTINTSSSALT